MKEFLREICSSMKPQFFVPNQNVFREGEMGDYMVFVLLGKMEIWSSLNNRREEVLIVV
jgi:hypothetical protein